MSKTKETPLLFSCANARLLGILHPTKQEQAQGVLIVVGGPQYRVGSHRQFVLLARQLAAQGIPVFRFDYRGMGDSEGEPRSFEAVDEDIRAALDCFFQHCPALRTVVIWGLCDAASAALFYGYQDMRVNGLVLLNPWVFTEQGAAKTYLKHYYGQRLLSRELWCKVLTLRFNYWQSLKTLSGMIKRLRHRTPANPCESRQKPAENLTLPVRMRCGLQQFQHPVLLILSGRDLTADEFKETVKVDPQWQQLLAESRVTVQDFPVADHTFSSAQWRDQVALWTADWVLTLTTHDSPSATTGLPS